MHAEGRLHWQSVVHSPPAAVTVVFVLGNLGGRVGARLLLMS